MISFRNERRTKYRMNTLEVLTLVLVIFIFAVLTYIDNRQK